MTTRCRTTAFKRTALWHLVLRQELSVVSSTTELTEALTDSAEKIQLLADIDISSTLAINRTVILDLNGHVLKMTESGSATIRGCSGKGSGDGVFGAGSGSFYGAVWNDGERWSGGRSTITGGTFYNTADSEGVIQDGSFYDQVTNSGEGGDICGSSRSKASAAFGSSTGMPIAPTRKVRLNVWYSSV